MKTLALALMLALVVGCAPKTVLTPKGKAAYTADQVLKVVVGFQNAAIQANQQAKLDDATAVAIVQTCVSIERTLGAIPDGWEVIVKTFWAELKTKIPPADAQRLSGFIQAVDVAIDSLGGGSQ